MPFFEILHVKQVFFENIIEFFQLLTYGRYQFIWLSTFGDFSFDQGKQIEGKIRTQNEFQITRS